MYLLAVKAVWGMNDNPSIVYVSYTRIEEWKYTEKGWFGYTLCVPKYPEVSEAVDGSSMIRIKPLSDECREVSKKCVYLLGYQGNNLLCSDWDRSDMEGLDYNGLYEYLYRMKYGERYEFSGNSSGIPAEEFENLIMEFLPITAEQIKKWAAEQQAARAANDAALAHAKHAITDFCENEGLNEPNFSDLTRVEFAYSTTEDDEHEIQVYANLLRNEIRYEVDGNIVHIDYFQDNHELAAQGIENSAFSDFINTAEAEFEKHHPTTRKVEKSPVTIGSTVYLEDARPFTVEEIGRENIHLRDESFPLVGRAVSHEEFARLLAANPKNAALSTPEVPSRQAQPEEVAESIVGEIVEEPSPFVAQVMADAERLSAEDEAYHREPITYEAPYLDNLPTAPREKFAANIAAIQKLKEIEQRVANGGSQIGRAHV